ncbi:tubulin delta chain-like isoform X2 [Emydura macquarii macquarii]|uniref:tubulin delta chain-like isoform X2 n=1 Tax=Emydura macquarii macquarii TaxID=1129001 RepID=UPI00352A502E
MSAVWLQVGQCGNQIGQAWWQILSSEHVPHAEADRYPFCSPDGKLNAICVDSEPKVVRQLQKQVKRGSFRESNLIVGKRGRGNNWAYGYHSLHSASEENLLQRTMESLRKEVECRDCYCGTVLFHSLSGGTGAGLGSRLCEAIRDEYSLGHILAVTVAPHQAGESALQHYNALLCLSWLQRHVDGVLLIQNDEVLRRAAALLAETAQVSDVQPQVSLAAMNAYIASCLAGLLYPLKAFTTGSGISMGLEPWELLRSVCPVPAMKFLRVAQARRRGTVFWDSLASSVVHSLPRESHAGQSVSFLYKHRIFQMCLTAGPRWRKERDHQPPRQVSFSLPLTRAIGKPCSSGPCILAGAGRKGKRKPYQSSSSIVLATFKRIDRVKIAHSKTS